MNKWTWHHTNSTSSEHYSSRELLTTKSKMYPKKSS